MPNPALVAALLLAASPTPKLSAMEQRYLEARDAAVQRFKAGEGPRDAEQQALDRLEAQLREIVGPVKVPGLAGPGKIAYEGFWGVGSTPVAVDGLSFEWGSDWLFVTTRALFLHSATDLKRDGARSSDDDMVSRALFAGHMAYATYAELPVLRGGTADRVRAGVGVGFQCEGPWPPTKLVVQWERGDRVILVSAPLEPPLEQVARCEKEYNRGVRDEGRLSDAAHVAYGRCYGKALPSSPSYKVVLARAQAIVDQLNAADVAGPPARR